MIACSRDLAGRFSRLANGLPVIAAKLPEPGIPEAFALHPRPLRPDEEMRVLYLGRLHLHKGLDTLMRVGELLRERRLRIRIDRLGGRDIDLPPDMLANPYLRLLGAYAPNESHTLICRLRPHLVAAVHGSRDPQLFVVRCHAARVARSGDRHRGDTRACRGPPTDLASRARRSVAGKHPVWLERLQRDCLTTPPRWLPVNHLPAPKKHFYETEYLLPLTAS